MRWRLLIEEFGPEFKYIQGKHNLIADTLSRLEMKDSSDESILDRPTPKCMVATISRKKLLKMNYLHQMVLKWLNPLV
jgi:hypothetical protein